MPLTHEEIKNGGILVKGEDVVTGNEIGEVNDIIYNSTENILKIKYQLWDLTNVSEILVSNADIEVFASQDAAAAKISPNMIIAIVANSDLIYGLSRMWEAYSYSSPFESMVFRNIEDAEKWIDEIMGKPYRSRDGHR
jgi:hypothetical protein